MVIQLAGGALILIGIWVARPRAAKTGERGHDARAPCSSICSGHAVAATHPRACLPAHLPDPPAAGRIIVLAAGKAAGSMTEVAEQHYLDWLRLPADRISGLAVTRHGYARPTRLIPVIEAGHPVPDQAGLDAAEQHARARRCRRRRRPRAGAPLRRGLGELDRARGGRCARRASRR